MNGNSPKDRVSEYLSFRLGQEEYGIEILTVQEIRGYEEPTRMVSTPAFVKGVLNLRGIIVPIVDMRLKFGLADVGFHPQTVTIVLSLGQQVVGMVVDAVSDVVPLNPAQIKPAPDFGSSTISDCVTGIAAIEQAGESRMLILLDIVQLMTSPEMGLVA